MRSLLALAPYNIDCTHYRHPHRFHISACTCMGLEPSTYLSSLASYWLSTRLGVVILPIVHRKHCYAGCSINTLSILSKLNLIMHDVVIVDNASIGSVGSSPALTALVKSPKKSASSQQVGIGRPSGRH